MMMMMREEREGMEIKGEDITHTAQYSKRAADVWRD